MTTFEAQKILAEARTIVQMGFAKGWIARRFDNAGGREPNKHMRVFSEEHRRKLSEAQQRHAALAAGERKL